MSNTGLRVRTLAGSSRAAAFFSFLTLSLYASAAGAHSGRVDPIQAIDQTGASGDTLTIGVFQIQNRAKNRLDVSSFTVDLTFPGIFQSIEARASASYTPEGEGAAQAANTIVSSSGVSPVGFSTVLTLDRPLSLEAQPECTTVICERGEASRVDIVATLRSTLTQRAAPRTVRASILGGEWTDGVAVALLAAIAMYVRRRTTMVAVLFLLAAMPPGCGGGDPDRLESTQTLGGVAAVGGEVVGQPSLIANVPMNLGRVSWNE